MNKEGKQYILEVAMQGLDKWQILTCPLHTYIHIISVSLLLYELYASDDEVRLIEKQSKY